MPDHVKKGSRKRHKSGKNTESQLGRVDGFNRIERDAKGRIPPWAIPKIGKKKKP